MRDDDRWGAADAVSGVIILLLVIVVLVWGDDLWHAFAEAVVAEANS